MMKTLSSYIRPAQFRDVESELPLLVFASVSLFLVTVVVYLYAAMQG